MHWSKKIRPTPAFDARRDRSSCVDMSTCSFLPSIAKRESAPRETGDSNMKLPPRTCAASATRALARNLRRLHWLALPSLASHHRFVAHPLGGREFEALVVLRVRIVRRTMSSMAAMLQRRHKTRWRPVFAPGRRRRRGPCRGRCLHVRSRRV
eukprot:1489427-Pleurochrysis_carterae.AAC.2